ncbi:MAG: DUF1275 family protein [Sphingopyxis sp.]|uniref:YoaK family protein n=1 Tax=Sphingopyxis sp. TaxID=1908224 RepID=UPI002ABC5599|nr:DUF1275 family protein [Sphingopyxis sp.]MDZ3832592.1 DUF1275 family protein [Sphingopyxis sp.]
MIRFDRSQQALAIGIALLAGFVDAVGFVESSGFFVSFMTGNSTRLAVGAAEWQHAGAVAAGIIAVFVVGVVSGVLVAARYPARRTAAVLLLVCALLAFAALLRIAIPGWPAVACLALAMGVANAALEGQGGAVVGVTYMTGTLVQMGHKIANALRGTGDGRWHAHLWLWMGLVGGAVAGAHAIFWSVPAAYLLALLLAAGLYLWALRSSRRGA